MNGLIAWPMHLVPVLLAPSHGELIPTIRSALQAVWQESWEAQMAHIKMGKITTRSLRPWSYSNICSRRNEIALTRLRTDHTRVTHGFLMSRGVQAYYNDCLVPMTVRHLLVKCTSLRDLLEQCHSDAGVGMELSTSPSCWGMSPSSLLFCFSLVFSCFYKMLNTVI